MKTSVILNINAIIFIALGIAFALYGPMSLAFLGITQMEIEGDIYWLVASFARMFGAVLFGLGFVIWGFARAGDALPGATRDAVLRGLLLGNLVAVFVAVTQAYSIWQTPLAWALAAMFIIFALLYLYLIITRR